MLDSKVYGLLLLILGINATLVVAGLPLQTEHYFDWLPAGFNDTNTDYVNPNVRVDYDQNSGSFMVSSATETSEKPLSGEFDFTFTNVLNVLMMFTFGWKSALRLALPGVFYSFAFPLIVIIQFIEIYAILRLVGYGIAALLGRLSV